MATYSKPQNDAYADIIELKIKPEILFPNSPQAPKKKYKTFHNKIKSAFNPNCKYKENKNLNNNQTLQSQTLTHTTIETPKIETRYKPILDKLNTNISSLRNKYEDLIYKNFSKRTWFDSYKMRFLKLKKEEEEKKKQKMKLEYLSKKNKTIKQEQEKKQKLKKIIKENKMKEIIRRKEEVQKLKNKEINDLKNLRISLKLNQMNKKRQKEEEKQFIEEELNKQKNKNLKEIEKRKFIKIKKEQRKAERIQGNKVYHLKLIEKDLESKVKIQSAINDKMAKQIYQYVQTTINDECVINPL